MNYPVKRALISVYDKTGLIDFAKGLAGFGIELVSTGGTSQTLASAGLKVIDVSEVTGFPEILDGRVKTLHPAIHAPVLARRDDPAHVSTLSKHQMPPIDMVVCSLYPFEKTAADPASTVDQIIEKIDVGGPTMIRAAAKNHASVAVVTDPSQYESILDELRKNDGSLSPATRRKLATTAFALTAHYDAAIARWFAVQQQDQFPERLPLAFVRKGDKLRYGENSHQQAAFYVEPHASHACIANSLQLHGKELSYNNILDLDSALNLVREFTAPSAVIIKHNNPCGAASASSLEHAFRAAYAGDPLSAFGGILAFNRMVDEETARVIAEPNRFIECIIAPGFEDGAFTTLTTVPTWKKNVRIMTVAELTSTAAALDFRSVDGGLLVQERDLTREDSATWQVMTKRHPTPQELRDLCFAWTVCKHVKSNAIVIAKDSTVLGVGAGQMSRIDSVRIAAQKAAGRSTGSALASDAFFPFPDNVHEAARHGITAIVQPGGSMRDPESIAACDELGIAMVFTGFRHFRH
jgi:phosphoribosylaminoimidazolecarboxamide formyltransferase/IMP cyclohydrolase